MSTLILYEMKSRDTLVDVMIFLGEIKLTTEEGDIALKNDCDPRTNVGETCDLIRLWSDSL